MNLIDRDEMISVFREAGKYQLTLPEVTEAIRQHPTVDAVVLPCKVGAVVYGAETSPVIPLHVIEPAVYLESAEGGDFETLDNFGKTVFLTREEAEAALTRKDDTQ